MGSVSFAPLPKAICSSLRCEIRAVVLHLWPDEIKVHPHVRVTIPVGRRGQPVQKLRYMPLAQAHQVARKLQGTRGATVSVICGRGLCRPGLPAGLPSERPAII